MMRTIQAVTAAGAMVAAMALSATPSLAQQVTLKLHVFIPPPANPYKTFLKPWADKVAKDAHAKLLATGVLVKVKSDLYAHAAAIDALRARLEAHLDERTEITPSEWKEITGASRKWSIPLAEYFDQIKLTLRVGDVRRRR